ncbi:hypothetical protein NM688_g3946 [Phlebia brevispora]|uniref:Uncharacterized protein n=1 Tax=Phlebia brevispora TaxID=194682 RepID=A0ACC1T448_9APHY|nr:hypothetical protein NM688_g3946 [Phlebia brevispora]
MFPGEEYKLLPDSPVQTDDDITIQHIRPPVRNSILRWIVAAQAIILLILLGALYNARSSPRLCSQLLYSPAQDAIVYETKRFHVTNNRSSVIYSSDPSIEVDKAWDDLYYDLAFSQISEAEARQLPNKTTPVAADPTKYITTLSVFHQLHCLNIIRKVVHSDYYADPVTGDIGPLLHEDLPEHVGHCLDFLRQGIIPITWYWKEDLQTVTAVMSVAHTCRKWENIEHWAKEHKLEYDFDKSVHVEDRF